MNNKLTDKKMGEFLFILCWLVYFSSYIGRLNYSSVMSSIIDEQILTYTQAGTISMLYFFAYGIGQFFNGLLGDHIRPQSMIFSGLFFSGLANLLMGIIHHFPVMALLWGINGYMQSMIWPPITRIFAEKYDDEQKKKCSIDIVSSMALGTLVSYFLSACTLKFFSWNGAFFLASGIMILISIFWNIGYKKIETFLTKRSAAAECFSVSNEVSKELPNQIPFRKLLLTSGLLAIFLPVMVHGILKDGVSQWVPTYICENFDVSASFSVILTMILPLVNLTGAYMAKFVDSKNPQKEVRSSVFFFGLATMGLLFLFFFGKKHILLTVFLFAVITSSMLAVNTLFVNLLPCILKSRGE